METNGTRQEGDDIDPVIVDILAQLWEEWNESPGKPWSLVKLGKRTGMSMSALLRNLTGLRDAGLVDVDQHEDGTGSATLSATGAEFCGQLFGESD